MEHLVRSIKKGYYICNVEPELTKEENDSIDIILSWEDGNKIDALKEYFSSIKKNEDIINTHYNRGYNINDLKEFMHYCYAKDGAILSHIFDAGILSQEEYDGLVKMNKQAEEEQLALIDKCYKPKRGIFHLLRK